MEYVIHIFHCIYFINNNLNGKCPISAIESIKVFKFYCVLKCIWEFSNKKSSEAPCAPQGMAVVGFFRIFNQRVLIQSCINVLCQAIKCPKLRGSDWNWKVTCNNGVHALIAVITMWATDIDTTNDVATNRLPKVIAFSFWLTISFVYWKKHVFSLYSYKKKLLLGISTLFFFSELR